MPPPPGVLPAQDSRTQPDIGAVVLQQLPEGDRSGCLQRSDAPPGCSHLRWHQLAGSPHLNTGWHGRASGATDQYICVCVCVCFSARTNLFFCFFCAGGVPGWLRRPAAAPALHEWAGQRADPRHPRRECQRTPDCHGHGVHFLHHTLHLTHSQCVRLSKTKEAESNAAGGGELTSHSKAGLWTFVLYRLWRIFLFHGNFSAHQSCFNRRVTLNEENTASPERVFSFSPALPSWLFAGAPQWMFPHRHSREVSVLLDVLTLFYDCYYWYHDMNQPQ